MAANFWTSTQKRHWEFSKNELQELRQQFEKEDASLTQQHPLPEPRLLNIYLHQQLLKLGKRQGIRQQAIATAQVYIKRFYTKVNIRKTNPYLLLATAFYLACKVEECPQHIRLVIVEARQIWPDMVGPEIPKLGEQEFHLIAELSSQLIVHHPYRTLSDLQARLDLTQEEVNLAWSIINDHYLTDLPLMHPPHVIAVTAILLAVVLKPPQSNANSGSAKNVGSGGSGAAIAGAVQNALALAKGQATASSKFNSERMTRLVSWLTQSQIPIERLVECIQEMLSLYEVWDQYHEKVCKEQIAQMIKGTGLDK